MLLVSPVPLATGGEYVALGIRKMSITRVHILHRPETNEPSEPTNAEKQPWTCSRKPSRSSSA